MFPENCTIINGGEFDSSAVEVLNISKTGPRCSHFKSHPKDKDKSSYPSILIFLMNGKA